MKKRVLQLLIIIMSGTNLLSLVDIPSESSNKSGALPDEMLIDRPGYLIMTTHREKYNTIAAFISS